METGGIAATYTESERGVTAQERMTLTSGVFIGGLPRPYDVNMAQFVLDIYLFEKFQTLRVLYC